MPASRLFWKLFLVVAALSVSAGIALGLLVSHWWQEQILDDLDRRLRDAAFLVSGELAEPMPHGPSETLQERVRELGHGTGARFTLIAGDGTVLADSQRVALADVRAMENLRDRPEIVQARMHGEGASSRSAPTSGAAQRHFATRIGSADEPVGFVRASLPTDRVRARAAAVRRRVWTLVGLVSITTLAASWWILRHLTRPVGPLAKAAEALAAGEHRQRLYVDNRDELGALARALNRISDQVGERVTQLGQTGDRQSVVLGGMIEGVIAVDPRERIVLANRAAGQLFDFRPPLVEGRPLLEVVRNHALHEAVTTALATGQPQRLETRREASHPAGPRLFLDIHVQPLPGRPCPGAVLVMHDTTELRRLESLRRDFIANVSHELKTPLSSIKAYTETLRNGAVHDAETAQRFLARIEEQSERLHRLIKDMLMLARIESEQQPFEIVPVDLPEAVSRGLDDHRAAAEAKRIQLSVEPNLPACRVRADREGLREILDNLIDNAIKYTPEGGSVTVGWREQDSHVRLHVRDTGIGIRPEDQRRVFERFYRVDKARSRELGGTGLGLAIVKHLVQSFGGKVGVESQPGEGSTFVVELPAADEEGETGRAVDQ